MSATAAAGRRHMEVEQAIFASADRGHIRGYQLVAQSPGISPAAAIEITRWSPTQLPDDAPEHWSISSWTLNNGNVAITRTVNGGPEYSNRGGIQVVTLILVLTPQQFQAYDCNAVSVARTAIVLGALRLPRAAAVGRLATVPLPDRPLLPPLGHAWTAGSQPYQSLLKQAADKIAIGQRIAVIGIQDPLGAVESLIARLTIEQRKRFGFTIGLSPSIRRPLQAHFYRRADTARRHALESEAVECLYHHPRGEGPPVSPPVEPTAGRILPVIDLAARRGFA